MITPRFVDFFYLPIWEEHISQSQGGQSQAYCCTRCPPMKLISAKVNCSSWTGGLKVWFQGRWNDFQMFFGILFGQLFVCRCWKLLVKLLDRATDPVRGMVFLASYLRIVMFQCYSQCITSIQGLKFGCWMDFPTAPISVGVEQLVDFPDEKPAACR